MVSTDQMLLTDYRRGKPGAFRELLERHAGLVYGTAWRVTGERTLAEEAVQDVFCLAARKSAELAGHPSVTGWLHRTAMNMARDLVRRRDRHERNIARFAAESAAETQEGGRPAEWEAIDAAIDRLPADERAVVVLRFFEELDHDAIGRRLGISEAAARKRLSRGLARLQKSMAAPAGSLSVAAPAGAIAATLAKVPAVAPAAGIFTTLTLMSQKPLLTAAAVVLAGSGLTWFGLSEHRENRRLSAELASLRGEADASARDAVAAGGKSGASAKAAESGAAAASAGPATADVEALRAELAAEKGRRAAAERQLAGLRAATDPLKDQVVVAFGKVNEIGTSLGSLFTEARALAEIDKAGKLDDKENETRIAKFMEKAASIGGLSKEIVEFEDKPEEGSRFVAGAYGAAFGLNEAEQEKVAGFFSRTLAEAKERKFTLSNLPERGTPEFMPWLEKRWAYFGEQRTALRETLPEAKRADFDQWVEKGGYGFKNLSLKGMPLMFSLGGDPR